MKKFFLFFIIICIVVAVLIGYGNVDTKEDLDTVNELFESMDEEEYNVMICTKKGGDLFGEQRIEIYFDANGVVNEVLINEKYSSKDNAETAYNKLLEDTSYEEIILDGQTLTYNATKSFEYEGKTKDEMVNIMDDFENDGITSGYTITWE